MSDKRIIIHNKPGSSTLLPGALVLPDAKTQVPMGSGVITSLISTGGMAIIYEIWNPDLEIKRAIKLLHPDHSRESEERFQTEMKISAKLHHPNIVEIYAVGKWNGLPYIEMERIDGVTVERLISESGCLPLPVCTSIGLMVGRALEYAHNQTYVLYGKEYRGIIHRDLKPSNIMVTARGTVKLMDFGIAKPMTATIHTCEGTVVGTMQYLAPEQLEGRQIDARADVYSLGTVLYEMLTGVRAFPESNLARLIPDKLSNTYVPLEEYATKIPAPLCSLVHRCMRHDPERRPQSILELLRSLDKIHRSITGQSPEQVMFQFMRSARTSTLVAVRRKPRRTAALIRGIIIPALMGGIGVILWYSGLTSRLGATLQKALRPEAALSGDNRAVSAINTYLQQQPSVPAAELIPPAEQEPVVAESEPEPETPVPPPTPLPSSPRSQPRPAVSPARQATATTMPQKSIKSGTLVELSALESEMERGNHSRVLALYGQLPRDLAQSKRAQLLKLRALKAERREGELSAFLLATDLSDMEFLLEKAILLFSKGDFRGSSALLRRAASSTCELGDAGALRRTVLFYEARCAGAEFDAAPGPETRKKAMEAWFGVKSMLRSTPGHEYFTRADAEIRRINSFPSPLE